MSDTFSTQLNGLSGKMASESLESPETNAIGQPKDDSELELWGDKKYSVNDINVLDFIRRNPNIEKAVSIFDKAAEKEKIGKMNDAVRYYRESMKLYSDVELVYRKKLQYEYAVELSRQKRADSGKQIQNTAESEQSGDELGDTERNKPCLLLDMLPVSILNRVTVLLLDLNQETMVNFVSTCSYLNNNCFVSNSLLFKNLAKKAYENQFYDMGISLKLSKQEKEVIDAWNINDFYKGDYRMMMQQRPYIKFQGVYISVNNYIRQGGHMEGSSSLYNPIHMVTYYRYFRFMPNGDCIRLLTTDEPGKVVKNLNYGAKDSMVARWSINSTESNLLTIERFDKKGNKCVEQLRIERHTKKLPHNKLVWEDSFIYDSDGEKVSFRLKNEKNFYFSRVRSYPGHVELAV